MRLIFDLKEQAVKAVKTPKNPQSSETMVSHWLIDSSSSALSSQHPQTLRFFPREVKNIKHESIDIFLTASRGQILTKTIRTREQLAELTASSGS